MMKIDIPTLVALLGLLGVGVAGWTTLKNDVAVTTQQVSDFKEGSAERSADLKNQIVAVSNKIDELTRLFYTQHDALLDDRRAR